MHHPAAVPPCLSVKSTVVSGFVVPLTSLPYGDEYSGAYTFLRLSISLLSSTSMPHPPASLLPAPSTPSLPLSQPPPSTLWYFLSPVLSGTASGITKLVVGHPFDTIKVRLQTEGSNGRFRGPLHCLRETVRHEGLKGLYKGGTPPLVGWGVIDSIMWGSLVQYRRILQSLQSDPTAPLILPFHFIAGGMAGMTSVVAVTPIEQVKARLQVQYYDPSSIQYRGPIDCVRKLVRNNGVRGLFNGIGATTLFRAQMAIYFGQQRHHIPPTSVTRALSLYNDHILTLAVCGVVWGE